MKTRIYIFIQIKAIKGLYFYKEERWIFREIFEIIRESGGSNPFIQNFIRESWQQ